MTDMKDAFEKATYNLEKFFQTFGLTEAQQEQLTKSLEHLADFSDLFFADMDAYDATLDRWETRFRKLGETDAHVGDKTLEYRLDMIEGAIDILEMSHLGHMNTSDIEFKEMHGYLPIEFEGNVLERINGMQKKLDKISNLLENFTVTMSVKKALNL